MLQYELWPFYLSIVILHKYATRSGQKESGHPQKYSHFGITITGRTENKENHIFLECFLQDLIKKHLKY